MAVPPVLIYALEQHEHVFTALMIAPPTLASFLQCCK